MILQRTKTKSRVKLAALLVAATAIIGAYLIYGGRAAINDPSASVVNPQIEQGDVTASMEALGNPFTAELLYARNVWDMQVYNGKLYFGHGDFGANTGPTPLHQFDPTTNQFTVAGTADDEALMTLRVLDSKLFLPGKDARDSGTLGNFYTYDGSSFQKFRTIPNAEHVNDLYYFDNKLYVSASRPSGSSILSSTDNGQTWTSVTTSPANLISGPLFELGGSLFMSHFDGVAKLENGVFTAMPITEFTPGISDMALITKQAYWQSQMVFIANSSNASTYLQLYVATAPGQSRKVQLPDGYFPYDLLQREDGIYVLAKTAAANGKVKNMVLKMDSALGDFEEVLSFEADTFARAFEYIDGYFYFGLGSDSNSLSNVTGDILRFEMPTQASKIGDVNGDGEVNILDLSALLTNYGSTGIGDVNSDGTVNILDLSLLLTHYGT